MVFQSYFRVAIILIGLLVALVVLVLASGLRPSWVVWGMLLSGYAMVAMFLWDAMPNEWIVVTEEEVSGPSGRVRRTTFSRSSLDSIRSQNRSVAGKLLGYWDLYSTENQRVRVNCALLGPHVTDAIAKELELAYPSRRWDSIRGPTQFLISLVLVGLGFWLST